MRSTAYGERFFLSMELSGLPILCVQGRPMTALKIWNQDSEQTFESAGGDLPERARVTVREWYETELASSRQRLSQSTLEVDRNAIGRWERFGGAYAKRWRLNRFQKFEFDYLLDDAGERQWLSDPAIGVVADSDLEVFVGEMESHGLSPSSISQTIRHLSLIFGHAGPRERGTRGQDVLIRRPLFPERDADPMILHRFLTFDEVGELYVGAGDVERISQRIPRRSIPDLGRALIVFEANYGLRPDDLIRLEWGKSISPDAKLLSFCAQKTKRDKPFEVRIPINDITRKHLLRIRQRGRREVFFKPNQERQLAKLWRKIVEASGVRMEFRTDCLGREYIEPSPYSLRRYCGDALNNHSLGSAEGAAGSWVLGHAIPGVKRVTARHYQNAGECPEYVRAALWSISQPSSFGS